MDKSILVSLEHRFYRSNGIVYTKLAFDQYYWSTYLEEFEKVFVYARIEEVETITSDYKRADTSNVEFIACPYYVGVLEFIRNVPKIMHRSFLVATAHDSFILRSGNVSNSLWIWLFILRKGYAREFPGDIEQGVRGFVSATGAKRLFVALLAKLLDRIARFQAKKALSCAYVSESVRALYPARAKDKEFVFSGVMLPPAQFRKLNYQIVSTVNILSVGRLEHEKGHRYLIQAVAELNQAPDSDRKFTLCIVGDGTRKEELQNMCHRLGVSAEFKGAVVDRDALFKIMAEADVSVLPSETEGMPRSLIECLSLGVPSLGSEVGGIPELLESRFMFKPSDPKEIVTAIERIIRLTSEDRKAVFDDCFASVRQKYSSENMHAIKKAFWATTVT